jgi:hypothetical protein
MEIGVSKNFLPKSDGHTSRIANSPSHNASAHRPHLTSSHLTSTNSRNTRGLPQAGENLDNGSSALLRRTDVSPVLQVHLDCPSNLSVLTLYVRSNLA